MQALLFQGYQLTTCHRTILGLCLSMRTTSGGPKLCRFILGIQLGAMHALLSLLDLILILRGNICGSDFRLRLISSSLRVVQQELAC